MRITYQTLAELISRMSDDQKNSDVTVEVIDECYSAELRIAGKDHDGGLDENHPVIYAHVNLSSGNRRNDIEALVVDLGIN